MEATARHSGVGKETQERSFDDIVSRESNQAVTVKNYHKKAQR